MIRFLFKLMVMLSMTLWLSLSCFANPNAEALEDARTLLALPEEQIDYAQAKLIVDKFVDPTIDSQATLQSIHKITQELKALLPPNASDDQKLDVLRTFVYSSGEWNHYQPYTYDLSDPYGSQIHTKLLSHYLQFKKGNCISMPIFLIILGQKLGLDLRLSLGPEHVFVKYENSAGQMINLETTSGANQTRDVWYRQQLPMTDLAIRNGIYLRKLSIKESVSVMVLLLAEHYMNLKEYDSVIAISDLVQEYCPKCVEAMLYKGAAYSRIITENYEKKYASLELVPEYERLRLQELFTKNHYWFKNAEELGWQEPKPH